MDFFETVEKRRSCRKFTNKPVPEAVIHKAIDAALLAPNSSNMQPWEFYWVRDPSKKARLVEACLSQSAAATAQELIVAVARRDTWRRNRKLMLEVIKDKNLHPKMVQYYQAVVPLAYGHGPFSVFSIFKKIAYCIMGFFRAVPRGPTSHEETFEVVVKTTALACENLMLAVVAQGYACCPMEGFDSYRVKRILGLGRRSRIVMVLGVGEADPKGIWGERVRFDRSLFVHQR